MINESPHASSAKTHLNCSQCRVEEAISAALKALQNWKDRPRDNGLWLFSLEKLDELTRVFEEHVARVAGEGVLEDAVSHHPTLYSDLRSIELRQSQLGNQLSLIADRLRRWQGDDTQPSAIAKALAEFRAEFTQEEQDERHVVERGIS